MSRPDADPLFDGPLRVDVGPAFVRVRVPPSRTLRDEAVAMAAATLAAVLWLVSIRHVVDATEPGPVVLISTVAAVIAAVARHIVLTRFARHCRLTVEVNADSVVIARQQGWSEATTTWPRAVVTAIRVDDRSERLAIDFADRPPVLVPIGQPVLVALRVAYRLSAALTQVRPRNAGV